MPATYLSGDTLYSSSPFGNQWFLNGNRITGATGVFHVLSSPGAYHVKVTNSGGCSATSSQLYYNPVSISESSIALTTIYPNPFTSSTTFELADANSLPYDLYLYDNLGREVRKVSTITASRYELQREDLPAGIYFYRLQSKNAASGGKLIIE